MCLVEKLFYMNQREFRIQNQLLHLEHELRALKKLMLIDFLLSL
jgi:hypothetical protein